MLERKTYTETELAELLEVKPNSLRRTYKDNLKNYIHSDRYKVSKGIFAYDIIDYKEKEKSEFIKLCEQVAGTEVKFPKEETAEKILEVLLKEDLTILDYEALGWQIPGRLERHTVSKYIKLFQGYKMIPKKLTIRKRYSLDIETGEILSKVQDFNRYTYYVASKRTGYREEVDYEEYSEMITYIKDKKSEYINIFLEYAETNHKSISYYYKEANKMAYLECAKVFYGTPQKAISKVPAGRVYEVFAEYFNIKIIRPKMDFSDTENFSYTEYLSEQELKHLELLKLYPCLGNSVIGRDPSKKDWDSFPRTEEDDEDYAKEMKIEKIKNEMKYFWKLRMNNKNLSIQHEQKINKLLKDRRDKLVSLVRSYDSQIA
ncbi:hypothetical protein M3699_04715 [Peribacillus simplex]|uniref:hypothetical protein n=1 Tax=Peribacillus simplex TaxID=1478 RepID=UPI00203B07B8|nr:hypothetical protein [Peribacillus simplex]MCM3673196.1 hypothetical protein [Peribacillus simplex]